MDVLIDNKDLKTYFGITCLDYSGALSFAAEREDERTWEDKSGVDKNLENIRLDAKEFVLDCICKADDIITARALVQNLVDYMMTKGCFILSLRDTENNVREAFLCERSSKIIGTIHPRPVNSLYAFKIGMKDVNPNALVYKTEIVYNELTLKYEVIIDYTKGQTAQLYWGNGDQAFVSNSGEYLKDDFTAEALIDVIVDIDKNADVVNPLIADFSADSVSGIKPFDVQFTDESEGDVILWSWDFGDGYTSSEQNPAHTYNTSGQFTVVLQVFNSAGGHATETKTNYIAVRNARLLINATNSFLINNTNKLLKN